MRPEHKSISNPAIPWALKELPPYRPVVRKLMSLTSNSDVSLSKIEEVLCTDAAFTSQVLRLANSAYFGFRARINGIRQAVAILGLDRIKALAITLAMQTFLERDQHSEPIHRCWIHNLATALICERLGRFVHLDTDTCYTAGMLHDIGRLALFWAHRAKYESITNLQPCDSVETRRLEREAFDIDHCQAGKWILEQWGFPKELADVAYFHEEQPTPGQGGLITVAWAGWRLADLLGFSATIQPEMDDTARADAIDEIIRVLELHPGSSVRQELEGMHESIAMTINAVECSLV